MGGWCLFGVKLKTLYNLQRDEVCVRVSVSGCQSVAVAAAAATLSSLGGRGESLHRKVSVPAQLSSPLGREVTYAMLSARFPTGKGRYARIT